MTHSRFLSLLFVILLSCNVSLSATVESVDTHLVTWHNTYVAQLSPQELYMLCNIVLNAFANAICDDKIEKLLPPLDRLTQTIRSNVTNQKNPDSEIALLKRHLDKLSYVVGTRTIYTDIFNTCLAYYNQHRTNNVDKALEALQLYCQNYVCSWADENNEKTQQLLNTSAKNFTESSQFFYAAAGLYQGLNEGMLPTPQPENYKSLVILDAILKNTSQLLHTTDSITNLVNHNAEHAINIICIGLELYKRHYEILYDIITSKSFDQRYTKTMFSMHGLLPEEYQSPLPHPDHVFEHMLQTTKLYTQAELVK